MLVKGQGHDSLNMQKGVFGLNFTSFRQNLMQFDMKEDIIQIQPRFHFELRQWQVKGRGSLNMQKVFVH